MNSRRLPLLLSLFCALIIAAVTLYVIPLQMDMQAFLPRPHDKASQFLLDELHNGTTQTLMIASIEGDDPVVLSQITKRFHKALAETGFFSLIIDGPASLDWQKDQSLFFAHRYALAPHDKTRLFTVEALKTDISQLYDLLQSMAAPLVEDIGMKDPTGAYGDYMASLNNGLLLPSLDGIWFTKDRHATLMLLKLSQPSLDPTTLKKLHNTIMKAFAGSHDIHDTSQLTLTGSPVFSLYAAQTIHHDMDRLAIFSLILVVSILYWRFRSLWVLAAIAVPFLLSLSVSMIILQFIFGWVHGIALGFGMTMLGVSLDYPVLLLGHRDKGERISIVMARIGTSLKLAVITAVIGLLSMILCGLPGIMQLGIFSATGILTAAGITIWFLPHLVTQADLAAYHQGVSPALLQWENLRRYRLFCLPIIPIALTLLIFHPFHMEKQGEILNPIPQKMQETDRTFRQQLGAPQAGSLAVIEAKTSEDVLRKEESLLARLPTSDTVEAATLWLPSQLRQQRRISSLPSAASVTRALQKALQESDNPFQPDVFSNFPQEVENARQQPALTIEQLTGTSLSYRLGLLLFPRNNHWYGFIIPRTPQTAIDLAQASRAVPDILLVNLKTAIGDLLAPYVKRAAFWLSVGVSLALLSLLLFTKNMNMIGRATFTLFITGLSLLALLRLHNDVFSIIHIVSLAFVLGIGIDYALFFGRPQLDKAERTRTMRTLLTCNIMTVLSFAILASCQIPLLRELGLTISSGAFLALIFSFLFMGPLPAPAQQGKTSCPPS